MSVLKSLSIRRYVFLCIVAMLTALSSVVDAQSVPIPNASFEEGSGTPSGWTLSGGTGTWLEEGPDGKRAIATTGSGKIGDTNLWQSGPLPFKPSTVYRLAFKARRMGGSGGCPVTGPAFCNRDVTELTDAWAEYVSCFMTPSVIDPANSFLRFGQWEVNGTVAYDAVNLAETQPVFAKSGSLTLGDGESVNGDEYAFRAPLGPPDLNYSRPLASFRCGFNSQRWVFGEGSEVVYGHCVGELKQVSGAVDVEIGYYQGGELLVQASADGQTWREVGVLGKLGSESWAIPADLFPATEVRIRLSQRGAGSLQMYGYGYRAKLDTPAGPFMGATTFLTVTESDPGVQVTFEGSEDAQTGGQSMLVGRVKAAPEKVKLLEPVLTLSAENGRTVECKGTAVAQTGDAKDGLRIEIPYQTPGTGLIKAVLSLGKDIAFRAEATFDVSELHDSSYGELLPASSDAVGLWWASSGWKVSRTRPLPQEKSKAIRIETAKNEAEAAQLVLRPSQALKGLAIKAEALKGPLDAVIPTECVELLQVGYVNVVQPTDKVRAAGWWPDPLPPMTSPIDLEANQNQPIWVRVKAPRDAAAGQYKGDLILQADGYEAKVPLEVTVFDFVLPDRMTCVTAFGFDPALAFTYQKVAEQEQKRAVYDKYLASLSAHHIGPYDPAALDPFVVTWPAGEWQGGVRDRSQKHAGESALLVDDANPRENMSANCQKSFPLPEKGLKLRFWYKTKAAGHKFNISLTHTDAAGNWMSGRNKDIHVEGNGEWQTFEQTVTAFPEGAKQGHLNLWGATYTEDGSTIGGVWFDELVLEDAGTGEKLVTGDFEPLGEKDLLPHFDFTEWDKAMEKAIGRFGFNGFAVPIQGMGGGTFHSRTDPSLQGYAEGTPEYQAMFSAYCRTLEQHLRDKGWVDMSYVYWFDEPDPKDYEFVMNGFRKLKENAPGIGRMLTEQIEPALVGGPNIWCPLTPSFDMELAEQRRAEGDKFWWYVCTGPKAPYVTLFIDHPGTEMRVWLWQTWERKIDGILIWQTNYWTSGCAYPDSFQNPYEDPMGWVSGYSTPAGTKLAWGNGDGRFMYPPVAAANGKPSSPVLEGPVDSIRFEMLRDGVEDYEYMVMLKKAIEKAKGKLSDKEREEYSALLVVPEEISTDLTHFTKDPVPIEAHRGKVAKALEKLGR